jgi:7-cyano-7-deazaguanine synthase
VPHGHYAAETMRATVVPNRNLIMLAVAGGIAAAEDAELVATGVHAGDHPIYPDCRPEFIHAASRAIQLGTSGVGSHELVVYAPFVGITKADICALGDTLDVPWKATWSCYEGAALHCGSCGTCVERREAFMLADVTDPTVYVNTDPLPQPVP